MKMRGTPWRDYFLLQISPVIRYLILSDLLFNSSAGLLGPIFAIYVEDNILGGNLAVIGLAAMIFLVTRSILQIPVASIIDRIRGEKDDFWLLFWASVIMAFFPLLYLVIRTPLDLYIVQFFFGLFTSFTFPSYMAIFTRHIDRHKEGTEWGMYFTITDLGAAIAGALGGFIAYYLGFPTLLIIVTVVGVFGALLLIPIKPYLKLAKPRRP